MSYYKSKLQTLILFLILINCSLCQKQENSIRVFVNSISPFDNPTETYRYYYLPYCQPENVYKENQSLGESLSGDRKMSSLYYIQNNQNITRHEICTKEFGSKDIVQFQRAFQKDYIAEFYIENISTHDVLGVKTDAGYYYLKNHIEFNIYLSNKNNKMIHANITNPIPEEDFVELSSPEQLHNDKLTQEISFYYSVKFHKVDPKNVQFIDQIETAENEEMEKQNEIHWLYILNSFILIILLLVLVSIVLQKTIQKDFIATRNIENDQADDVNWKKIRTEALLPPSNKLLLSAFIGQGVQFLYIGIGISLLGALGTYYGHHKGNQKTFGILIFAFTGLFKGYYASKHYKLMGGKHWALTILCACLLYPGIMFFSWSIMNSIAWYNDSTAAIPFGSVFFILSMFLLINIPLTILGGITGRIKNQEDVQNLDFSLPRLYKPMPPKKIYQKAWFQFFTAGLLPFSSVMLELYYIVQSVWGHHIYHLYGILLTGLIILICVHICSSITLTYLQLNSQDYNWWWRSFINGGSFSFFMMLYSIYHYFYNSQMSGLIQGSFYFGYMTLFSIAMFLMMGSISFLVSRKFVFYIYSQAKLD